METSFQALRRHAFERPHDAALKTPDHQFSYKELFERVCSLANALREYGVKTGDVVAIQLPNLPVALMLYYATHAVGAIVLPLLPSLRERDLSYIFGLARPRVYISLGAWRDIDFTRMASEILPQGMLHLIANESGEPESALKEISQKISHTPLTDAFLPEGHDALFCPDEPATVIFTSGTSGRPKGVVYSHRSLFEEGRSMSREDGLTPQDIVCVPASLGHIAGVACMIHLPMFSGSTLCTLPHWRADLAVALIQTAGCTWMLGATPFLDSILNVPWTELDPLSGLRTFRCGGADVPPSLIETARRRGIDAYRSFGMSEHPTVSGRAGQTSLQSISTDGLVHKHVDIRIVDPADENVERELNKEGEIATRGPDRAIGYLGRDGRIDRFDPDTWLLTGDLGVLGSDGSLRITGRKKDLIIRKGENISPKEIEDLLSTHESLFQVAVVGIPDKERNEMVCCCVVVRRPGVNLSEICAYLLAKGLPKFKLPEHLVQLDDLPRNQNGKVDKKLLRDIAHADRKQSAKINV